MPYPKGGRAQPFEKIATMEDEVQASKSIGEYLAILRRYKGQILVVTAVVAAAGLVTALSLPPIYRSTATVLVQEQEVPPELVRSTITSFADERIQVISQQVMTRAVLLKLVEKYNLYEKYRRRATTDELLERMRKDIKLTTVNADVSDRSSGRRVNATIAFKISYDSPQAERAQQVVTELTSLYLAENIKVREQSVAETTAFLTDEADRLESQIQDIEGKLALFKRRYAGRLPDSSAFNLQLAERAGSDLSRTEREMSAIQERKAALQAQLATVPPNAPTISVAGEKNVTPAERLRSLKGQYLAALAVYKPDHPDIRRMEREIAALTAEAAQPSEDTDAPGKLNKLESDLANVRERYSESHPDVERVKREIAALQASSAKDVSAQRGAEGRAGIKRPDNPAYIALTSQIDGIKRELNQLEAARNDLRAQQRTYDARLQQIPEIEREYHDLTRDYDTAKARYRDVKEKQMRAVVSQELEKGRKAERFSLSEPANLPEKPVSPNRPAIAAMGFLAAIGSGLGLAGLRDALDPSVKGPLELARIVRVPILTAIPYIETRRERIGKRRRNWLLVCLFSLLATGFLSGVHVFLRPLPLILHSLTDVVTNSVINKFSLW